MLKPSFPVVSVYFLAALMIAFFAPSTSAQISGKALYTQIGSFHLTKAASVNEQVIKVDRVTVTLTGTLYFSEPVSGKHTGAVFVGTGRFNAPVPDSSFEKAHVRRLLKADAVETNFSEAVFRMSDDSLESIAQNAQAAPIPAGVQKIASEHDERIRKETGASVPGRLAVSILNKEQPGVFFSSFRGGKLDDFSYVFDPFTRIPTSNFSLNGGEKGVIYTYKNAILSDEVWMAFYSLADYERGIVQYSDANDLVDITAYEMETDLSAPKSKISLKARMKMIVLADGATAIPFSLGESLSRREDERLKKQLRVAAVRLGESDLEFVQDDWEGGFTVFLTSASKPGDQIELDVTMQGDFLEQPEIAGSSGFSYPRSTTSWYPRHGYLDRSVYKFTFTHLKKHKVVCVGDRISESPALDNKDLVVTQYQMDHPISLATFALGPFVRHNEITTVDGTDVKVPLEFNSIGTMPLKEDFIIAELNNSVRYFYKLFGAYPYKSFSASFHPYGFGQGFPSMLMIPNTDRANKHTYAFISHETGHQWWGNIVAWRSYRDQWLSEGFAEYSGVLYTALRDSPKASVNLIDNMRTSIRRAPETMTGQGKGRLNDVGPIILGHRLTSTKTYGGYQTLVYNKGALVLRMLHFLFTDPNTGSGDPFYEMMRDFVERYRNKTASTDDFRLVANEHFVKTPTAKRYSIKDLNWFFQQWVYETHLPSYTLEYAIEPQPDGSTLLTGNVIQEGVPENFFMPLPVRIGFGGDKMANGTVAALGPKTPFKIKLPAKPIKVELDPNSWVLSEKTSTK